MYVISTILIIIRLNQHIIIIIMKNQHIIHRHVILLYVQFDTDGVQTLIHNGYDYF